MGSIEPAGLPAVKLALVDQPNSREICDNVFGERMGFVPYVMPGFGLAKAGAEIFESNRNVEGLILDKHGIFTFGETARESYERMIDHVSLAEAHIDRSPPQQYAGIDLPVSLAPVEIIGPILRGAVATKDANGQLTRFVCDYRENDEVMAFVNRADLKDVATRGVSTPDLSIRIKMARWFCHRRRATV